MEKKKTTPTEEQTKQLKNMSNNLEQSREELDRAEAEKTNQELKEEWERLAEEAWYYGVNPKDIGLPKEYWHWRGL